MPHCCEGCAATQCQEASSSAGSLDQNTPPRHPSSIPLASSSFLSSLHPTRHPRVFTTSSPDVSPTSAAVPHISSQKRKALCRDADESHPPVGLAKASSDPNDDATQREIAPSANFRRTSRRHHSWSQSHTLLHLISLFILLVSLAFLPSASGSAVQPREPGLIPTPTVDSRNLEPRDVSHRARPGKIANFHRAFKSRALMPRQTTVNDTTFELSVSSPATCKTLNITWDPTKGTAPFTLLVVAELWFPLALVEIDADYYSDPDLRQWLYQMTLPSFATGTELGSPTAPNIVAALIDSSGAMANTSVFQTPDTSDTTCANISGSIEFPTWYDGAPTQCHKWEIGWNCSGSAFKGPLMPMVLAENQVPLVLVAPDNLTTESDGTGGMNWTVSTPAGTRMLLATEDAGTGGTGGIGGVNIVGLDSYAGTSCALDAAIGMFPATATAASASITPEYTTRVTTTSKGAVYVYSSIVSQTNHGSSLSTEEIVGVTMGVAIVAGLIIGLIFWLFFRRQKKKSETKWDIPDGASKYPKGMPVDRSLLSGHLAGMGRFSGPTRTDSFNSIASDPQDQRSIHHASNEYESAQGSPLSPTAYLHPAMPYSDLSPFASDAASEHSMTMPKGDWGPGGDSPPHGQGQTSRRQPNGQRSHLANAYRHALASPSSPMDSPDGITFESHQMSNRSPPHTVTTMSRTASLGRHTAQGQGQYTTSADGYPRRMTPSRSATMHSNNVVVHSDAGLLMDDRLSDDEDQGDGGTIELPPTYASLPARAVRNQMRVGIPSRNGSAGATLSNLPQGGGGAGRSQTASTLPSRAHRQMSGGATNRIISPLASREFSQQDPFHDRAGIVAGDDGAGAGGVDHEAVAAGLDHQHELDLSARNTLDQLIGDAPDEEAFWRTTAR